MIFCNAIVKVLNKHSDWKAVVAGDEPREMINVNHKNLTNLGFQKHSKILDLFKKVALQLPVEWEEPLVII